MAHIFSTRLYYVKLGHLLVHSQSNDDEQRQYAKSQVCAVLRRRVPNAQKPAPLHRFLVHGQSSDDKQRPYAKSQVCGVLRRRVPPCTETSAAAPFSRPRNQRRCTVFSSRVSRAMISSARTPSLKSVPFFVEEFHRARKPAPLHRFLVQGQSSDDK
ncbi:hypothetical protein EVAR_34377_1 [Eumeta japonica]|uniref:Uncharacterized protein n=1 Tax=Eumeta variegata TaxID=151549 RepID=A0A4C1YSL3_EUMVA|nr:hypothetical protein EVAR_34377_1 [Eumeta japonica]